MSVGGMVAVFVHAVLTVEFVHLVHIDKNKNDETKDGTLLRHPETKLKSKEADVIQNVDEQDGHSKGNREPYR